MELTGRVHSFESFGLVDGPGVRSVVFMQGCRMRCKYCHNPETWRTDGGTEWTPRQLWEKAGRYRNYWGKNGGITVSGGEPLLWMEFVTEFFRLAKEERIHTALDTAGNPFCRDAEWLRAFDRLMDATDLFLLDIKEMDADRHRELTGWGNENILDMASYLSAHGKKLWIRHVLVPGLTDGEEELSRLRAFAASLGTVERVEILPYHTMGRFKWEKLGVPYPLEGVLPPTKEEIACAEELAGVRR